LVKKHPSPVLQIPWFSMSGLLADAGDTDRMSPVSGSMRIVCGALESRSVSSAGVSVAVCPAVGWLEVAAAPESELATAAWGMRTASAAAQTHAAAKAERGKMRSSVIE
jgi:hypothetical protein